MAMGDAVKGGVPGTVQGLPEIPPGVVEPEAMDWPTIVALPEVGAFRT